MFNRMYSFLLQNDILYKYQFGFRKGFSTSEALIELLDTIYFRRDNHDFLIGMFYDLQKAFDTVSICNTGWFINIYFPFAIHVGHCCMFRVLYL